MGAAAFPRTPAPARAGQPRRLARDGCAAAMLLAAPLFAFQLLVLSRALEPGLLVPALLAAWLGILAVDGLTGLVHWACDTWGDERTPGFGPHLIRSFREHHRDPRAMLAHDWVEVNREPVLAAGACLLLLALPSAQATLAAHPLLHAFGCGFIAFGALANQLHRWAHGGRRPRLVCWLQRRGWILSPRRHAEHHLAPHLRGYCISTGWLNPVIDACDGWRKLERVVTRATGLRPRAHEGTLRVECAGAVPLRAARTHPSSGNGSSR